MRVGDHVTWLHVPRGGYGYSMRVDARILAIHVKQATVQVKTRAGELARRRVALTSLREKPRRGLSLLCKYCGCTLGGVSEVSLGSGVYDRLCHARDGDMCERTVAVP
jgi:hypothetical protein